MKALLAVAATLALAVPAGLGAEALGVPLPWLLGPLVATGLAAMAGLRVRGAALRLPAWVRPVFVPVIAVAIGATVTPEIVGQAARWWPSLLATLPYVALVQLVNYAVLRRIGGYDRPTAFFAASPGGLVDAVISGEQRGGGAATMSTQHFARIALTVAIVPLLLAVLAAPGGEGPVTKTVAAPAAFPDAWGVAALLACAALGSALGRRLRLPASVMLGPFLLSAALHVSGVTRAEVPEALVHLAQIAVGSMLGLQFAGLGRGPLIRGLGLSLIAVTLALSIAAGFALALAPVVPAPMAAVFLAFAPGGVAEMGLVAVSLGAEPAFVIVHHLLRIVLTVAAAPLVFDLAIARRAGASDREATPSVPPDRGD